MDNETHKMTRMFEYITGIKVDEKDMHNVLNKLPDYLQEETSQDRSLGGAARKGVDGDTSTDINHVGSNPTPGNYSYVRTRTSRKGRTYWWK